MHLQLTDKEVGKPVSNGANGVHNGHSHGPSGGASGDGTVAPVAYMIIFGDAVHNFIDGLSIGSAFTVSVMTGVSVSVAIMCEELPHELGKYSLLSKLDILLFIFHRRFDIFYKSSQF